MAGIFISYRRDDSRAFAEQIHGALAEHFGEDRVFFDIEDIGAGAAWADVLRDFLADPGVLVAVIGPDWATTTDGVGNRRLHMDDDWVRREVASAIRAATVLPVLVNGATLPSPGELPPDLRRLSSFQATTIDRNKPFHDHVPGLVRAVEQALARRERAAAERTRTNIVRELTDFIGRADEVEELERELTKARLVTITGPGGVGKSRLAREAALNVVHQYDDGAWLVALADLHDPHLLEAEVATVLGVPEPAGRPLRAALLERVANAELLLILNNCDQVVDRAAELAHALARGSRRLRILATCREALGVPGEAVWALAPLELPPAAASPSEARHSEAVQLFAARARLVDRTFHLADDQTPVVAEVCRFLDGLPLAIELAAANVGATSVDQLAARLRAGTQALETRSRLVEPRQRTLQDTIRWSHELLAADEQAVLDRLAVFRGGFAMAAAQAAAGWGEVDPSDVAPIVFRLVDKSLVAVAPGPSGEDRYRLYRAVRQFALDRLAESGGAAAAAGRHAAHYLAWAEEGARAVVGEAHPDWMERFGFEDDNLRAACEWAVDSGDDDTAIRLGAALIWFWYWSGRFGEARDSLRRVNEIAGAPDSPARATALFGEGLFASSAGELERAADAFRASADVAAALGDPAAVGRGLMGLGTVALFRGDLRAAASHLDASEEQLREVGRPPQLPLTLRFVGAVAGLRGDVARAQAALEEALAMLRATPSSGGVSWGLDELGDLAARRRDFGLADEYLRESLKVSERIGGVRQRPWTLLRRAQVARGREDEAAAAEHVAASIGLFGIIGETRGLGWALCEQAEQAAQRRDAAAAEEALDRAERRFAAAGDRRGRAEVSRLRGDLALAADDASLARRLHREALDAFVAAEDMWGGSHALEGLGRAELARERLEVAARLMGAAQGLQESLGVASPEAIAGSQELMAAARRLGVEAKALRRAWEAGVAETDEPSDLPITVDRLAELTGPD